MSDPRLPIVDGSAVHQRTGRPGWMPALRGALTRRFELALDRWIGPVGDAASTDRECLAAEVLWWDPRVLPRSSAS